MELADHVQKLILFAFFDVLFQDTTILYLTLHKFVFQFKITKFAVIS